jgi:hypothetical protein
VGSCGRSVRAAPGGAGLAPVLAVLADAGVLVPDVPAAPVSPEERLLAAFERYLLCERALAATAAAAYVMRARRFLAGVAGGGLAGLAAGDVTRAVEAPPSGVAKSTGIRRRRPVPRPLSSGSSPES